MFNTYRVYLHFHLYFFSLKLRYNLYIVGVRSITNICKKCLKCKTHTNVSAHDTLTVQAFSLLKETHTTNQEMPTQTTTFTQVSLN